MVVGAPSDAAADPATGLPTAVPKEALENFLLKDKTENALVKATDWGLSTFYRPSQSFHDIVGSAYYIAPEVTNPIVLGRGAGIAAMSGRGFSAAWECGRNRRSDAL